MKLKEFIYSNREKNHLTQTQLADMLHVSNTTISNYENGISTPDVQKLIQMAQIFHTSLDNLTFSNYSLLSPLFQKFISVTATPSEKNFKLFEIESCTEYPPYAVKGDFLLVQTIQKRPPAGTLLFVKLSDGKHHIYKLSRTKNTYILTPLSADKSLSPITIKHLTADMYEIKSIVHFF